MNYISRKKLMVAQEADYSHGSVDGVYKDSDNVYFIGDLYVINDKARWEDIAVHCGLHASKGEAKRNGFKGEIPEGLTIKVVGKLRKKIAILK